MVDRRFIIQYGLMTPDQYAGLKNEFPKDLGESVRSHKDLYVGDEGYSKLMDESPYWNRFHQMIHCSEFWETYCAHLGIEPPTNFRPDFHEPRDGIMQSDEEFTYARMDIGLGLPGYGLINGGRGNHIDNPQRIISGLLYFTNQHEIEGGEFEICNQYGGLVHRVPLSENMVIISAQNKDAWHRVNPLIRGERRAVYFSLSSSKPYWDR